MRTFSWAWIGRWRRQRGMPFPVLSSVQRYQQRHRKSVNCKRNRIARGRFAFFIFRPVVAWHDISWSDRYASLKQSPGTLKTKFMIVSNAHYEMKLIIFSLFSIIARRLLWTRESDSLMNFIKNSKNYFIA